jgi:trehalose utilization protein
LRNTRLSVIVWNEFVQERNNPAIRSIYPDGLHSVIAQALRRTPGLGAKATAIDVSTATQDQPEHGLGEARLQACDVLIWWGSIAQDAVSDEVVQRIHRRVLEGMGLIVLHSGYSSKIFRRLLGTSCSVKCRATDEKERLWVVAPSHPIAAGLSERFELPAEETYGESFDIAQPDSTVFISWFEGGEVFRSGCCWERGYGRLFYFRPGNIRYPTFHDANVQRVLANAVQWVAPRFRFNDLQISPPKTELAEDQQAPIVHAGKAPAPAIPLARESAVRAKKTRAAKSEDGNPRRTSEPTPLFPTLMTHLYQCETKPAPRKLANGRFPAEAKRTAVG